METRHCTIIYHLCFFLHHLIKPLIFRCSLQNALNNALQFVDCCRLFGICEDCRLVTPDHKKHILR